MNGCKFSLHLKILIINPFPPACRKTRLFNSAFPDLFKILEALHCEWSFLALLSCGFEENGVQCIKSPNNFSRPNFLLPSGYVQFILPFIARRAQIRAWKPGSKSMISYWDGVICQRLKTQEFQALKACLTFMYRPGKKSSLSWYWLSLLSDPMSQGKPLPPDPGQSMGQWLAEEKTRLNEQASFGFLLLVLYNSLTSLREAVQ